MIPRLILILAFTLLLSPGGVRAQVIQTDSVFSTLSKWEHFLLHRDQDTSYIQNLSEYFAMRLFTTQKYNYFQVADGNQKSYLGYNPRVGQNIGIGVSYKWFSIDIAANLTGLNKLYPEERFVDLEANMYTSKQYVRMMFQYYFGYDVRRVDIDTDKSLDGNTVRSDVRTSRFRMQYFHAFNYDRFSIKAPFVSNEIQKKSAGSILGGFGFDLFILDGDSALVPKNAQPYFHENLHYRDLNNLGISLSAGYIYTWVPRDGFFASFSLIPGAILNMGDYQIISRTHLKPHLSFYFKTMNGIGYTSDNWYTGLVFKADVYSIYLASKARTDVGTGRLQFYVGYRFGRKKRDQLPN